MASSCSRLHPRRTPRLLEAEKARLEEASLGAGDLIKLGRHGRSANSDSEGSRDAEGGVAEEFGRGTWGLRGKWRKWGREKAADWVGDRGRCLRAFDLSGSMHLALKGDM